jgi:epoxyqueuosine reductase
LSHAIKRTAHQLGFAFCRITPVDRAPHADFFDTWLELGRAGEMTYLTRYQEKRRHPRLLADADAAEFRSLIALAVDYHQFDLPPDLRDDPSRGVIASYAWGDDYHEIIRPLLYELDAHIREQSGRTTRGKCLVDTGPVLERDWALRAGIGFTGKNCCTIRPGVGSWLFLATILVPEELQYDPPPSTTDVPLLAPDDVARGLPPDGHYGSWRIPIHTESGSQQQVGTCGRCTRCLTDCPTDAFVGPFHLDPQRCISYWTIEARTSIPRALRPHFGNRIFGCDICQEVCPWNQRLASREPRLTGLQAQADRVAPPLLEGFQPETPYWLEQAAFSARFRRSPVKRAKRHGMLRNICVALGNWAAPQTVDALARALADAEPLARAHAAWALGQVCRRHADERAVGLLRRALPDESVEFVQEEIAAALA